MQTPIFEKQTTKQTPIFKNRRRRGACDYCLEGQSMKRRIVVNVQLCG